MNYELGSFFSMISKLITDNDNW